MMNRNIAAGMAILLAMTAGSCKKNNAGSNGANMIIVSGVSIDSTTVHNHIFYNTPVIPTIRINCSAPVDETTVTGNITLHSVISTPALNISYANSDSTIIVQPQTVLAYLSSYTIELKTGLKSVSGKSLQTIYTADLTTRVDTTNKFAVISDSALLTLVQQQTFKYFWDFGHPVSGMARERNTSGDVVTTGGTGFGIMSMLVGVKRNFITRSDALIRLTTIVNFLTNNAQRYHGAFSHWINGSTGVTVPFSDNDDGADIVETSYLLEGLLCARQYFNTADPAEVALRDSINSIFNGVEWNFFRNGGQDVLYWNWSPDKGGFVVNVQVRGWCEALITYVMASSSSIDSIPVTTYTKGWAQNGAMSNGHSFYGVQLPLGPDNGGPLFFAHYSFMGINPNSLVDAYANYWTQNTAHSQINYNYCVANPAGYNGYGSSCWGLTASDDNNGYSAHEPNNDDGVISPTAAVSSLPYTPVQSMNAIRFFYYKLGDKIWGTYGFADGFNLTNLWYANSFLAIDQGPQIVMIENYRSGMMWDLFMSCPEVKRGMRRLGFTSPYL